MGVKVSVRCGKDYQLYFRVINKFINIYQGLVNMDVGDLNMNAIGGSEYFDY